MKHSIALGRFLASANKRAFLLSAYRKRCLLFIVLCLFLSSWGQSVYAQKKPVILKYTGFTVQYNPNNRQPDWAEYTLYAMKEAACTVDKVESMSKIDVYSCLPDKIESLIESQIDLRKWGLH